MEIPALFAIGEKVKFTSKFTGGATQVGVVRGVQYRPGMKSGNDLAYIIDHGDGEDHSVLEKRIQGLHNPVTQEEVRNWAATCFKNYTEMGWSGDTMKLIFENALLNMYDSVKVRGVE